MIAIREADARDGAAVIALWRACELTRPWNDPEADFHRALHWPGSSILVAEDDESAIATAMVGFDGHRGWIYYLAVAPDRQSRGIARSLLERCEEWLRERGCPKIELMVRQGNPAARFYEHLGWGDQDVQVFGRWLEDRP